LLSPPVILEEPPLFLADEEFQEAGENSFFRLYPSLNQGNRIAGDPSDWWR
jgi:hypothetical protein